MHLCTHARTCARTAHIGNVMHRPVRSMCPHPHLPTSAAHVRATCLMRQYGTRFRVCRHACPHLGTCVRVRDCTPTHSSKRTTAHRMVSARTASPSRSTPSRPAGPAPSAVCSCGLRSYGPLPHRAQPARLLRRCCRLRACTEERLVHIGRSLSPKNRGGCLVPRAHLAPCLRLRVQDFGIANGMSIARVWTCRHSKWPPRRGTSIPAQ